MSTQEEVNSEEIRFKEWAEEYQVFKTLPDNELELTEELEGFIWTEFQDDDYTFIDRGFTAPNPELRMPVVGYFISKKPFPEGENEYEPVLSSLLLDCPACDAMGEDETGEECETCMGDRGTYIDFSL